MICFDKDVLGMEIESLEMKRLRSSGSEERVVGKKS
jgi:hypothetical protein